MYILNDLWMGNISPCERFICSDSEYQKIFHQLCKESEILTKEMSLEQKSHYEEIQTLQMKLEDISEADSFVVGFRLGARMILDVVGEYHGQFKSSDNSL